MGLIIDRWSVCRDRPVASTILPDGCRDIIMACAPGQPPEVFVSDLDLAARRFQTRAGVAMTGHRLRPGAGVCAADVAEALRQRPDDPEGAMEVMLGAVQRDADIEAVLAELASELAVGQDVGQGSLAQVARHLGVSPRQMQRRFAAHGLPAPGFWAMLGRARLAAGLLAEPAPLSDIAYSAGYADQSHMNRDFVRFFGTSPAALRADRTLLAQIAQPGLATGP